MPLTVNFRSFLIGSVALVLASCAGESTEPPCTTGVCDPEPVIANVRVETMMVDADA